MTHKPITLKLGKALNRVTDYELNLLLVFKTVVEYGGFAASEEALRMSRSAISMKMKDLEERLGMVLCKRGRGGFSLTDEGIRVLESSERLFGAVEQFKNEVNDIYKNLQGSLTIGFTDSMITHPTMTMIDSLGELKEKGQDITVHFRIDAPNKVETGVLDGSLNIGVVPKIRVLSGLDYLWLYEEATNLYCAYHHPLYHKEKVTITDLAEAEAAIPDYVHTEVAHNLFLTHKQGARASSREGILFLVLTGRYIGYLPDHYARSWELQGKLKVLQSGFKTQYYAITATNARKNLVLEAFLALLLEKTDERSSLSIGG